MGSQGINSVTDIMLRKWLLTNGVKPSDLTIVEVSIPQMGDLLKAGTIDAATAVEPVRSRIASTDVGYNAAEYYTAVDPDVLLTAWMATGDWARKNGPALKAFREALDEGLAYIRANPDPAKEIEKKYLSFNAPRFPTFTNAVKASDLQIYADISKELGLLKQPAAIDKLVIN